MHDLDRAIQFAKGQVGRSAYHGLCQGLSRTSVGVPPFGRSASVAFETCRDRGWAVDVSPDTQIPAGSIVYYSKAAGFGGHDATVGHATFCVKSGTVLTAVVVSNDVGPNRTIGAVHPRWFRDHWNMKARGYIVRCPFGPLPIGDAVVTKPDESVPVVFTPDDPSGVLLSNLTPGSSGPDVVALQKALIANGFAIEAGATGNYKTQTIAAVKAAQEAQGLVGADADGAVGRKTCLFLGLNVLPEPDAQPKDLPRDLIEAAVGVEPDQSAEFWRVVESESASSGESAES